MRGTLVIFQVGAFAEGHKDDVQIREDATGNKSHPGQLLLVGGQRKKAGTADKSVMNDVHVFTSALVIRSSALES